MRSNPRRLLAHRRGRQLHAAVAVGVVLSMTLLAAPAGASLRPAQTPQPVTVRAQVAAMKALVARSADQLARGVLTWEASRTRLDVLLQQQQAAERAAEVQQAGVQAAQQQLDSMVRAAYVYGMTDDVRTVLSLDPQSLSRSLDAVAALDRAGATTRGALLLLTQQRAATAQLASQRDALRRQAQRGQTQLDDQLQALSQQATQAGAALTAAEARLDQLRAAERAAAAQQALASGYGLVSGGGGAPCSAPADGQYANGFLPDSVLCPLQTAPGQRLVAAAAAAFDRMSAFRAATTGSLLCVTDSYRDYASQVAVFAAKPSLAATPGRSNHGWGLAVDLCGGAQSSDSEVFRWLQRNAPTFGFVHPAWAEPGGRLPEPWHWEFVG